MHLTPEHEHTLHTILHQSLRSLPLTVYVFGSRAGKSPRPDSDLDLLLDIQGDLPLSMLSQLKEALEESNLPFRVDVVCRTDVSPEFYQRIKDDLIPLWRQGG
jgi:uncharacterized protein